MAVASRLGKTQRFFSVVLVNLQEVVTDQVFRLPESLAASNQG